MPLFLRALNYSAVPNTLIFNSLATKGANIMDEKIAKLKEWIDGSDNIVFFGGAGVSTESGIPDFRSVDGLYNQQYKYPPETILSHTFFLSETIRFLTPNFEAFSISAILRILKLINASKTHFSINNSKSYYKMRKTFFFWFVQFHTVLEVYEPQTLV